MNSKMEDSVIPLRHLQRQAIRAILGRFSACLEDDVDSFDRLFLLGLAVGQGKTRVICAFIREILDMGEAVTTVVPSILVAVPPTLVEQWSTELGLWKVPFTKITLPRQSLVMESYPQVCLSSFTPLKNMFEGLGNPAIVIVDEPDTIQIAGISHSSGDIMTMVVSGTLGITAAQTNRSWLPIKFFGSSCDVDRWGYPLAPKELIMAERSRALTFRGTPADLRILDPVISVMQVVLPRMIAAIMGAIPAEAAQLLEAGATGAFMEAMGFAVFPSIKQLCDRTRDNLDERIAQEKAKLAACIAPHVMKGYEEGLRTLLAMRARLQESIEENAKICNICGDDEVDPNRETLMCQQCLNIFCKSCMLGWMESGHQTCPHCRQIVVGRLSAVCPEAQAEGELPPLTSVKNGFISALQTVMQDPIPVKRILVAGSHHEIFREAHDLCSKCGCDAVQLIGTVAMRQRQVNDFKTRETSTAFIINSNDSAAGINIPELTHTIIVGNMPQGIIDQIIGRGQRPGRVGQQKVFLIKVE